MVRLVAWVIMQVLDKVSKHKERILLEHQEMRLCVVCQVRGQMLRLFRSAIHRLRLDPTGYNMMTCLYVYIRCAVLPFL